MDSGADWRSIAEVVPISRWRAVSSSFEGMAGDACLLVFGRFVVVLQDVKLIVLSSILEGLDARSPGPEFQRN